MYRLPSPCSTSQQQQEQQRHQCNGQSTSTVRQAPQDISATLQHVFYVHSIQISMHKAANAGVNIHW
jgi:hypothetical protein